MCALRDVTVQLVENTFIFGERKNSACVLRGRDVCARWEGGRECFVYINLLLISGQILNLIIRYDCISVLASHVGVNLLWTLCVNIKSFALVN